MIIALHGGFTGEMAFSFLGGFISVFVYFIWVHYSVYQTKYYHDEFVNFSIGKKLVLYLGFLLANLFVGFLLFWILTLIFAALIF